MTGLERQMFHDNIAESKYFHNTVATTLNDIYHIMKECYGPYGSHILIDNRTTGPIATKDGKEILSNIHMSGTIANAIHRSILNVANKQVEEVGDGSTTTILLLCKLYEAFTNIINQENVSPTEFQTVLKHTIKLIMDKLEEKAIKVVNEDGIIDFDMLENAVNTSVDGNKDLCDIIMTMLKDMNCTDPLVVIENSPTTSDSYELVKGVEVQGSIISSAVFFNGFSRFNYENPQILVINGRFDLSVEMYNELADARIREDRDLIILATGISETLINVISQINQTNPGHFVRCPVFQIRETNLDDSFLDLCAAIGANPVDSETTKKWITANVMRSSIEKCAGSCEKAVLTEYCARFNSPNANEDAVKNRLDSINVVIEDLKKDPSSHNQLIPDLEARKAFLNKNYAKFYVGGESPQRKAIRYELVNDAIPQAISCMKHGIITGCNLVVPSVIAELRADDTLHNKIMNAISNAYIDLTIQLINNKFNDTDKANKYLADIISRGGDYFDLRGNSDPVYNSADTDRSVLQYATDMASLLATTRGYLSINPEFDIVNKGL